MVSTSHKFIYIRVPKCASSSIKAALDEYFDDPEKDFHWPVSRFNDSKYDDYYKFGCVRNTYERLISWVFHKKKQWDPAYLREICNMVQNNRHIINGESTFAPLTWYLDQDVDYIMQYDNLQNDFNLVCDSIQIPRIVLPKLNASKKHNHYSHFYTDDLRELVEKTYAEEIDRFNFKYEEI